MKAGADGHRYRDQDQPDQHHAAADAQGVREAAVELARLAQRRLEERVLPSALRISAGVVVVWLVLVALPVTVGSGVHPAALAAGVGVGVLLFSAILLIGRRQLRLARRAEQRNLRLLGQGRP